jgi:glycerol uptake facilitator-like aquaporin
MLKLISIFGIEFIASAMFHFIGSVSATPVTNGLALMVLVYYSAKTSNAHINPALSLAFCIFGYIRPLYLLLYWSAQISGCIIGALFLAMLVPGLDIGGKHLDYDGCFRPAKDVTTLQVFGWEAICTFNFFVTVFAVVWYTIHKKGYGNTGPIMIGISLMINAYVSAPFTGGAMNPARVLGSYFIFDCNNRNYILYYIFGQLFGAILTTFAIIPWYGISSTAWYLNYLNKNILEAMYYHQPSLRLPG